MVSVNLPNFKRTMLNDTSNVGLTFDSVICPPNKIESIVDGLNNSRNYYLQTTDDNLSS